MISTKFVKVARKWLCMTFIRREGIFFPRTNGDGNASTSKASSLTSEGHIVVYSSDQKHIAILSTHLKTDSS